jgi:hypothetical protein
MHFSVLARVRTEADRAGHSVYYSKGDVNPRGFQGGRPFDLHSMDLGSLSQLQTEGVNPRTSHIDRMSTIQMCTVINADDHLVAESVAPCLPVIAGAIDALTPRVRDGGRVVYVGAGTSGRSVVTPIGNNACMRSGDG